MDEQIQNLKNGGKTNKEISQQLNITLSQIYNY